MNETDATRAFETEETSGGSFLIRFSTSKASEGWFVLVVDCEENGVQQFQIEHDPVNQALTFAGKNFETLPELVKYCSDNYFSDNFPQLLVEPCPKLPLNEICKGYAKAQSSRTSSLACASRGRTKNARGRTKATSRGKAT